MSRQYLTVDAAGRFVRETGQSLLLFIVEYGGVFFTAFGIALFSVQAGIYFQVWLLEVFGYVLAIVFFVLTVWGFRLEADHWSRERELERQLVELRLEVQRLELERKQPLEQVEQTETEQPIGEQDYNTFPGVIEKGAIPPDDLIDQICAYAEQHDRHIPTVRELVGPGRGLALLNEYFVWLAVNYVIVGRVPRGDSGTLAEGWNAPKVKALAETARQRAAKAVLPVSAVQT